MIMKRIADDDTTGRNRRAGKDPAGGSGKRPYCSMIHRYSSRRNPLKDFLATQLQGARRYDRIAGFFSSSLLEVAGEALERMKPEDGKACVRVVCKSCLNPLDVQRVRGAQASRCPVSPPCCGGRERRVPSAYRPADDRLGRSGHWACRRTVKVFY